MIDVRNKGGQPVRDQFELTDAPGLLAAGPGNTTDAARNRQRFALMRVSLQEYRRPDALYRVHRCRLSDFETIVPLERRMTPNPWMNPLARLDQHRQPAPGAQC